MPVCVVADTRERFSRFGPYVASIARDGTIAFWALLPGGGDGVFAHDGDRIVAAPVAAVARAVISHPDIDARGDVCAYADLAAGGQGVVVVRDGTARVVADTAGALAAIGPLGPTMNDAGAIAFRATDRDGHHAVMLATGDGVTTVADTRGDIAGFEGLPVVDDSGAVAYRAALDSGEQVIRVHAGGATATAARTGAGSRFRDLARFPTLNGAGAAVFCATHRDGTSGVYVGGERVVDSGDQYDAFRGALATAAGDLVFYATPPGGPIGIYAGGERILSIGDPVAGSTVAAFVLNPVSINDRGQLALRLELADGTEAIARWDP